MNRDLEKILKEKWYLVAADFIAVIAVISIGFDPKDGLQAFFAVLGILGASLIVVVPVLMDGGDKKERLAEQARLRTALAAEIDRLRDDFRAGTEAVSRRVGEIEVGARQAGEAAAAAVAQRASSELNALKASVAALEAKAKTLEAAVAAQADGAKKESVEELSAQVESLAGAVRGAVADVEEAAEAVKALRAEVSEQNGAVAEDVKKLRDDLKKSGQKVSAATDKLSEALDAVQADLKALQENPPVASAPSPSSVSDEEPEAVAIPARAESPTPAEEAAAEEEDEDEEAAEESEEEVAVESAEVEAEEDPEPPAASAPASGGTSLTINLMIGIGNKPYVRGTGPGLSPDKGQPMTFLGIGRWQWVSPEPDAPATVEVWKNDQAPLGEPLHLSGGAPVEVDEGHFTGS